MSIQAIGMALRDRRAKGLSRLVLISLANYANDNLRAWPSLETITRDCNASRKGIIGAIVQLEEMGCIEKIERQEEENRCRKSNIYVLHFEVEQISPPSEISGQKQEESSLGVVTSGAKGSYLSSPEPLKNHQLEPSKEPTPKSPEGTSESQPKKKVRRSLGLKTLIELIPEDFPHRELATEWAEFKCQLPASKRYSTEIGWKRDLKRMALFSQSVLANAIDKAISKEWQGWEHDMPEPSKAPAEPTPTQPDWTSHPKWRQAAGDVLNLDFDYEGDWQDIPRWRHEEIRAYLENH